MHDTPDVVWTFRADYNQLSVIQAVVVKYNLRFYNPIFPHSVNGPTMVQISSNGASYQDWYAARSAIYNILEPPVTHVVSPMQRVWRWLYGCFKFVCNK